MVCVGVRAFSAHTWEFNFKTVTERQHSLPNQVFVKEVSKFYSYETKSGVIFLT